MFINDVKEMNLLNKIKTKIKWQIDHDCNLFLIQHKDTNKSNNQDYLSGNYLEWFLILNDNGNVYDYLYDLISKNVDINKSDKELNLFQILDINWRKFEINWFNKDDWEIYVFDNLKKNEDVENDNIVRNILFSRLNNKEQEDSFLEDKNILDSIKDIDKTNLMNNTILSLDITMSLPEEISNKEEKKDFLDYIQETNNQVIQAINNMLPLINYSWKN